MATQQIAWTVDGLNNLAVLYPDYQTAPYTADWNITDLTVSAKETVMVLTIEGAFTVVHHAPEKFPLEWTSTVINLDKVKQIPSGEFKPETTEVLRIDASPDDTLYMVLNSGLLAQVKLPENNEDEVEATLVKGISGVSQISAAADGLVWVVANDPIVGSVVKWMDPKKGKWNQIPDLRDAIQVTGGPKGQAYVIDSAYRLASYTQKGVRSEISCRFSPRGLSIGPDGRLWIYTTYSGDEQQGGCVALWTDDKGENWTEVSGSNVNNLDAGIMEVEEFA